MTDKKDEKEKKKLSFTESLLNARENRIVETNKIQLPTAIKTVKKGTKKVIKAKKGKKKLDGMGIKKSKDFSTIKSGLESINKQESADAIRRKADAASRKVILDKQKAEKARIEKLKADRKARADAARKKEAERRKKNPFAKFG